MRLRGVPEAQRHTGGSCVWPRAVLRPAVRDTALLSRYVRPGAEAHGHRLRHPKVRG